MSEFSCIYVPPQSKILRTSKLKLVQCQRCLSLLAIIYTNFHEVNPRNLERDVPRTPQEDFVSRRAELRRNMLRLRFFNFEFKKVGAFEGKKSKAGIRLAYNAM